MSVARGPDQSVFDDLSSRFILNCPPEELGSFERIMFLIEQAHWFYEDTLRHEKQLRWACVDGLRSECVEKCIH